MITEHATAFLDRLRGDPNLTVFDGAPPDLTKPPYVVVWISLDDEESVSQADEQGKANLRATVHSVGSSGNAARIISDRVRARLHGHRLVIANRNSWKVRHEFGIPPQRDESTGVLVVDAVDVYVFSSYLGG